MHILGTLAMLAFTRLTLTTLSYNTNNLKIIFQLIKGNQVSISDTFIEFLSKRHNFFIKQIGVVLFGIATQDNVLSTL